MGILFQIIMFLVNCFYEAVIRKRQTMKSFIIPAKIRPKNERYEAFVEFMENRGFYKNFNDYESLWQFGGRMATVKELSEAFLEFEKLTEK